MASTRCISTITFSIVILLFLLESCGTMPSGGEYDEIPFRQLIVADRVRPSSLTSDYMLSLEDTRNNNDEDDDVDDDNDDDEGDDDMIHDKDMADYILPPPPSPSKLSRGKKHGGSNVFLRAWTDWFGGNSRHTSGVKRTPSTSATAAKRSPSCMRKCLEQGFLHPAQCHSLC